MNSAKVDPHPKDNAMISSNPGKASRDRYETQNATEFLSSFKKRVCKTFIDKKTRRENDDSDPICECGYQKSKHEEPKSREFKLENLPWDALTHTTEVSTDAFGEIQFTGVNHSRPLGKYIRVAFDTSEKKLLELIKKHWELHTPKLLISVTGGAKNFVMKPRLKEVFNRGLVKAAESTDAWIITAGTHSGVMKHVGRAVGNHFYAHGNQAQIVTMGIAPWGCIEGRDKLVNVEGQGAVLYPVDLSSKSALDYNHSHFILVDNGTQGQYYAEIKLRTRLESAISEDNDQGNTKKVPTVCVMVEGGRGTIETVNQALKNETPTVIIEGSGRAADILAYAYFQTEGNGKEINKTVEDHLKDMIEMKLYKQEDCKKDDEKWVRENITEPLEWVKECVNKKHFMTVFTLDHSGSTHDLDAAILNALLKVNNGSPGDQLNIALAWNRADVAREKIFTDEKEWQQGKLDTLLYKAIVQDKTEFVKLFLSHGVKLKKFVTRTRVLKLYNDEIPTSSILYEQLDKYREPKNCEIDYNIIGNLIKYLVGDFYQPLYLSDKRYINFKPEIQANTENITQKMNNGNLEKSHKEDVNNSVALPEHEATGNKSVSTQAINTQEEPDFNDPPRELFIWSILMLRMDMSLLLWEYCDNGIAASLTAQKILNHLSNKTNDIEVIRNIEKMNKQYHALSVGLLSLCHSNNEKKTQHLLIKVQPDFGNATNLELAIAAEDKTFMSHAACQSLLSSIWMGNMTKKNGFKRLFVCAVLPLFICLKIKWRDDVYGKETASSNKVDQTGQKHKADNNCCTNLHCLGKFISFYDSPVIKFGLNCASLFVFLILYSLVMLTSFHPIPDIQTMEMVLIAWIGMLLTEEIRQFIILDSHSMKTRFAEYFGDPWNILDGVTLIMSIAGFTLRFIPSTICTTCFEWARLILCLNLMTYTFRVLHMFSISKRLGPLLVMIGSMMKDMAFFLIILMVFIFAYGLALQGILYPNSTLNIYLLRDVFYRAYWQIYGELFLEELTGDIGECSTDPNIFNNETAGIPRCPENDWLGPLLLGAYILITNVMMLNLLIAIFSNTFSTIQEKSDLYWNFQRYSLVREYYFKPALPPPFIFITHMYLMCKACFRKCDKSEGNDGSVFRKNFKDPTYLVLWESMNAEEYLRTQKLLKQAQTDTRIKEINERVDTLARQVEDIMETNMKILTTLGDIRTCQLKEKKLLN